MAKGFDPDVLTKTFLKVAQDMFNKNAKATPSEPPTAKSQNIIEYEGRMSLQLTSMEASKTIPQGMALIRQTTTQLTSVIVRSMMFPLMVIA